MSEARQIIRGRALATVPFGGAETLAQLPTLDAWLQKVGAGETGQDGAGRALRLEPGDDVGRLDPHIAQLDLIAIQFPKFTEGRGYSQAWLLRQRLGFAGDLRAFGDLGRDHLWQLARVGCDSFDLRDGTDLADALAAFDDFPERYQASTDEPSPLFRRLERAHA